MDRSYLSDERVVAAARDFVCIRLSTYESAEEEKILEAIFVGRSGDLENTTFAILSPDGKKKLCRPGRGPFFAYAGSREMAENMKRIATGFEQAKGVTALPLESDLRLGLNVASCDDLPLAVVVSKKRDPAAEKKLAKVALGDALRGRFVWVHATPAEAKEFFGKAAIESGVLVVAPGDFGLKGEVLLAAKSVEAKPVATTLSGALKAWKPLGKDDTRSHVRRGKGSGVHWKTKIPVTDPGGPGRRGPRRGGRAPERRGREL